MSSKLSSLSEGIDDAVRIGKSALSKFDTNQYPIEIFLNLNFLERFTFHLQSIRILLKSFEKDRNIENSIGLILRACLLDFLNLLYLSSYQFKIESPNDDKSAEEFSKRIESFISDHIIHTIDYLIDAKNSGFINSEEYKSALDNTKQKYSFIFNEGELDYERPKGLLVSKKSVSAKKMFKRIHEFKLTRKYSKAYDLYLYFGKYEHFGIMTHYIQQQGRDHFINLVLMAVRYIVFGIHTTLILVSNKKSLLEKERQEIEDLRIELGKIK